MVLREGNWNNEHASLVFLHMVFDRLAHIDCVGLEPLREAESRLLVVERASWK